MFVDNKPLPNAKHNDTVMTAQTGDDEQPPPEYTSNAGCSSSTYPPYAQSAATTQAPAYQPPTFTVDPSLTPMRRIFVTKSNGRLTGSWAVNPGLAGADGAASTADGSSVTEDVYLHSSNGRIDVNVSVLPHTASTPAYRTAILAKTSNGPGRLRVHAPDRHSRTPLHLTLRTSNGSVTLLLPRSFRGSLKASTTNGSVKLSDDVQRETTSVIQGKSGQWDIGGGGTNGNDDRKGVDGDAAGGQMLDEAEVRTTNGSVHVSFEDEESMGKGLLAKWFGV
ncbi:hypothetical protein BD626DRAFT_574118 [Schizophyllum amplum]|uniref:DUF7330 domain-containing protein n=1 Tax=Schizophyllum amplum TaxID=97359 RepID=A0A550BYZ7_9AGAR|nr:hypothetical protein BD626DRAFT_574118 [Auriculariopsis ampla]